MFDLVWNNETNDYLKTIRKCLKEKGYNKTISKSTLKVINVDYTIEYFTRPKTSIMFEIEKDNINKMIKTRLHYIENGYKKFKEIQLSDIVDLC